MDTRLTVVRTIVRRRNELADDIRSRIGDGTSPTRTLVRSLLSSLARAIGEATSASVTEWIEMVHAQHERLDIIGLIATACDRIERLAETLDIDHSELIVFLEIVKSHSSEELATGRPLAVTRVKERHSEVIQGMLAMLRIRDDASCSHSQVTGAWSRRLATAMQLPSSMIDVIALAGLLHDIGKIGTPESILFKAEPLNDAERVEMCKHAECGAELLSDIPSLARYATIVRSHHERYDGAGYPDGLRATDIPFESRVIAVADAFHAMISARPYRAPITQREALAILRDGAGTQWDPLVVDAMLGMLNQPRSADMVAVAHNS